MRKIMVLLAAVTVGMALLWASEKYRVIFVQDGIQPAVVRWYYALHRDAFRCKDDPYSCSTCPVGKPDRVVVIPDREKSYDVPSSINAWFACGQINTLIPQHEVIRGHKVWDDVFLCTREPQDGFVVVDGKKFDCKKMSEETQNQQLGTIQPGETKGVTITVPRKP